MKISTQSTIAECERVLLELAQAPFDEALKLPSNFRHVAGGAEAALAQLVVTWAQRNDPRTLQTYVSDADQISAFVRRLPGLAAALCADEIDSANSSRSLLEEAKAAALTRLEELQSPSPASAYRGPSTEIVCADHIGRDAPYLLYQSKPEGGSEIRSRENFRSLAVWLVRKTVPKQYRSMLGVRSADAIGGMLYELFKNTEDHGRVDVFKNVLDISIRSLLTRHFAIDPGALIRMVAGFPPLESYCQTLGVPAGAEQTHLFEISILDSGPGFASSWTGIPVSQLTDEQEERAVRECFGRGSAKGRSHFGEGLPHVMRLLHENFGFLRL